jgi:hypothetical protein
MPAILDTVTGITRYTAPLKVTDITLEGIPSLPLQPIEVVVYPDGWGYIVFLINPETGQPKTWVDGQQRTCMRYGAIAVVP